MTSGNKIPIMSIILDGWQSFTGILKCCYDLDKITLSNPDNVMWQYCTFFSDQQETQAS